MSITFGDLRSWRSAGVRSASDELRVDILALEKARPVTEGNHMLQVSSVSDGGTAVGTVSSFRDPGTVVSFRLERPEEMRRLTDVHSDVLGGVPRGPSGGHAHLQGFLSGC